MKPPNKSPSVIVLRQRRLRLHEKENFLTMPPGLRLLDQYSTKINTAIVKPKIQLRFL